MLNVNAAAASYTAHPASQAVAGETTCIPFVLVGSEVEADVLRSTLRHIRYDGANFVTIVHSA